MVSRSTGIVYIVGAGFSAGLGFPTVKGLLQAIWPRLVNAGLADAMSDIIRFHHPAFNPALPNTFVNVERLLSEMQANEELFDSSRPATGRFSPVELADRRRNFLLEIANWFHEKQGEALTSNPPWLTKLVERMKSERAQVISFNWDLILDELLFG